MRANNLKAIWESGKAATNCWIHTDSAFVVETMAHQGWDSLTIDMQHGLIGVAEMHAMLLAASATDTVPLVRVPWNDPAMIMKALDAGAYGVICPMVNNGEECERFVGACRYMPDGYRSVGPNRAIIYGGSDYMSMANQTVLAIAMIETNDGLANLDEICATPGLDAILIGPSDLGLSLGGEPRLNQTNPVVLEAIDRILAAAKANGLRAAIVNGSVDYAREMVAKGFDMVTVVSDMALLRGGFEMVRAMKD
ncbi:MAG: HpcH/HpaI aldolase/citrate lyase family protein [Sphingomonadales bacterium]